MYLYNSRPPDALRQIDRKSQEEVEREQREKHRLTYLRVVLRRAKLNATRWRAASHRRHVQAVQHQVRHFVAYLGNK